MKKIKYNNKESIGIISVELVIVYSIYGTLVQLKQYTSEDLPFSLSILDKDMNKDGEIVIEFSSFEELISVINDAKNKFKQFNQFKDDNRN